MNFVALAGSESHHCRCTSTALITAASISRGLNTVVAVAVGYRAATDKYTALGKVRFPKGAVLLKV
jgi:hypothetical protein